MTDAALSVTQSAIEQFAEAYLQSVGCSIQKIEDEWQVTVPANVDSKILAEDVTLVCAPEEDASESEVKHLHPESQFAQELLSEASQRAVAGKIHLPSESATIQPPVWIKDGDVEIEKLQFTPYYDRSAVVILFRVAIETVSEYQREFLRAVALDCRTQEPLRRLEHTFLNVTSPAEADVGSSSPSIERNQAEGLVKEARSRVVERVQDLIDEIHKEASRAADAEVEEFRQMQQQRIEELENQRSNLSSRIEKLASKINTEDDSDRVEALKERQDLKAKYDDIDDELEGLQQRRDRGFPERQREIRERHALEVRISPLTLTEVEYESGEIELTLSDGRTSQTLTVGYGSGVGVTESVTCSSCGNDLTAENPISTIGEGVHCEECTHSSS